VVGSLSGGSLLCIFCQRESTGSTSTEHIIPESLGNVTHTLRRGVVCDRCNQYFGSKVEGPLLDSEYFRHARGWSATPSKKGHVPGLRALHPASRSLIELVRHPQGGLELHPARAAYVRPWTEYLATHRHGQIYIPDPRLPCDFLMSRFPAKVALEALADRLSPEDGGLEFVATDPQLDPLRRYARYGGTKVWPFHRRDLYPADITFFSADGEPCEVLHEWTLLYTGEQELFLICAVYGVEYAVNLGSPEVGSYLKWIEEHAGQSYLDMLPSAYRRL